MTRILVLLSLLYAVSASAGLMYDFRIVTSGPTGSTIAGKARIEGSNFRIDFDRGDGLLIRQGMFMIGKSGEEAVMLASTTNKSYSELKLGELAGGLTSMLRQFGVSFAIENPRVRSRGLGDGGVIEGFPTRRSTVNANFDVRRNLIGTKTLNRVQMRTESWSTSRIPGAAASFLPFQGTRTGIPEVDKLLAAQTAAVQGFPLKQVTTVRVVTNGRESTTTSTANIRGVVERKFSAADFAIPNGFKKVESSLGQLFAK
jgi:hypothetical protein